MLFLIFCSSLFCGDASVPLRVAITPDVLIKTVLESPKNYNVLAIVKNSEEKSGFKGDVFDFISKVYGELACRARLENHNILGCQACSGC